MGVGLGTERMRLDPLTFEHVALLLQLDSDPEVMRFITGGRASSRTEVEDEVHRSLGHRWVAFDRAEGRFVGWFALVPTGGGEYELGYRLCRDSWGRGLATEGCRVLVGRAFAQLAATRVWAQTMAVNVRSRRVMEACGLKFLRTFHEDWQEPIDGAEFGDVEYELRVLEPPVAET
jgi:RimJ/RimL family protein N-acetyltransferase